MSVSVEEIIDRVIQKYRSASTYSDRVAIRTNVNDSRHDNLFDDYLEVRETRFVRGSFFRLDSELIAFGKRKPYQSLIWNGSNLTYYKSDAPNSPREFPLRAAIEGSFEIVPQLLFGFPCRDLNAPNLRLSGIEPAACQECFRLDVVKGTSEVGEVYWIHVLDFSLRKVQSRSTSDYSPVGIEQSIAQTGMQLIETKTYEHVCFDSEILQ